MTRRAAAVRSATPPAEALHEDRPPDPGTPRARTAEECLRKAAELDLRAAQAPEGPIRNDFLAMAGDWRRLAAADPQLVNLWR